MTLADGFVLACASLLAVTAGVHSVLGERRLVGPLLRQREGILQHDLARFLVRAVWHFMSVTFLILAVGLLASVSWWSKSETALLAATAIGIGGSGIYDAFGSRGRHIGWPLLVAIGLLAGLALLSRF